MNPLVARRAGLMQDTTPHLDISKHAISTFKTLAFAQDLPTGLRKTAIISHQQTDGTYTLQLRSYF